MKKCIKSCCDREHLKFSDINHFVRSQNSQAVQCAVFSVNLCLSCSGMQIKEKPHFYSPAVTRWEIGCSNVLQLWESFIKGWVRRGKNSVSLPK